MNHACHDLHAALAAAPVVVEFVSTILPGEQPVSYADSWRGLGHLDDAEGVPANLPEDRHGAP